MAQGGRDIPFASLFGERGGRKSLPSLRVFRVHQLDALSFDSEIMELMTQRLMRVFAFFTTDFVERFKPEITALLHLAIFRMSIWSSDCSYGQQIQNLIFSDARRPLQLRGGPNIAPPTIPQKLGYAALTVGLSWISARFERHAGESDWMYLSTEDWRYKLWTLWKKGNNIIKVLNLVNLILFLYNGKYVNLTCRLLKIRLVYKHRHRRPRGINFEFLNRQLVWQEFIDFFIFLLPLINLSFIVAFVKSTVSRLTIPSSIASSSSSSSPSSSSSSSSSLLPCPICSSSPIITPHVTQCGHVYCYYCVRVACMEDEEFGCVLCGAKITQLRPLSVNS